MTQEQHTPADWMISNVRDVVGASAQQVKETSKTSLDATRAVMEIYRDAPSILRDRADSALHAITARMRRPSRSFSITRRTGPSSGRGLTYPVEFGREGLDVNAKEPRRIRRIRRYPPTASRGLEWANPGIGLDGARDPPTLIALAEAASQRP